MTSTPPPRIRCFNTAPSSEVGTHCDASLEYGRGRCAQNSFSFKMASQIQV